MLYENSNFWANVGLKASLTANGVGKRYFDIQNTVPGDRYTLFNSRIGVTFHNLDVYIFGNNLMDETYIEYHFPAFGRVGGEPRMFGAGVENGLVTI